MLFVSIFLGGILPSWRRKCKFFLKTESPSSSFVVVLKIKSALNPAIKNNKTGNSQNFFDGGKSKNQLHQGKITKNPKFPLLSGGAGKNKIFSENHFLSFCIYDRWSFLIFPSIYAPFRACLVISWRQNDGKEKAPFFRRCENHSISWSSRASLLSLLYFLFNQTKHLQSSRPLLCSCWASYAYRYSS